MGKEKSITINGKVLPRLLVIQYASVRHTESMDRVRLHTAIREKIMPCSDFSEWCEGFNEWIEKFLLRMGKLYPHIFERAKPPKEVYGIPVYVKTSWKCKICGYHTITPKAPKWMPCWKAVWMFCKDFGLGKNV